MRFYSTDGFTPETSVGYLARRVYQLAHAQLEPLFEAEGLTMTQWSALVSIHFGHTSCAGVARELSYDKGATTRLVDTLEERGWVTRDRGTQDRRVVNLALTAEGEALALRCREKVIDGYNGWLEDWSREDVTQLISLLARLRDTLVRLDAPCA